MIGASLAFVASIIATDALTHGSTGCGSSAPALIVIWLGNPKLLRADARRLRRVLAEPARRGRFGLQGVDESDRPADGYDCDRRLIPQFLDASGDTLGASVRA